MFLLQLQKLLTPYDALNKCEMLLLPVFKTQLKNSFLRPSLTTPALIPLNSSGSGFCLVFLVIMCTHSLPLLLLLSHTVI